MTPEDKLRYIPGWIDLWASSEVHNILARNLIWRLWRETGNILITTGIDCPTFDDYIKSMEE